MACKICLRAAPEVEFYASIATHCKEHWRERVRNNRAAKVEHYRTFDRARANLPHRIEARSAYMQTDAGKTAHVRANREYRRANRKVQAAHNAVARAVKKKKILPMPCIVCGADAQAHHPDYDQPLDVIWLCEPHHKEVHAMGKN